MDLVKLARNIKFFFINNTSLDGIYKEIVTNPHLEPIVGRLKNDEIVKTVFAVNDLYLDIEPDHINSKLENLFTFVVIEFGDDNNELTCDYCGGDGYVSCGDCYGNGTFSCSECGGDGKIEGDEEEEDKECPECDGSGDVDCPMCDGGQVNCEDCNGSGTIETTDYVPYKIFIYASTDLRLKKLLNNIKKEKGRVKNDDIWGFNDLFKLDFETVDVQEGESESIIHDYARKTYLLSINQFNNRDFNRDPKKLRYLPNIDLERFTE